MTKKNKIENIKIFSKNRFNLNKLHIRNFLEFLLHELNIEINKIFVYFEDKKSILKLNKKFLNHEYHTDIITFSYGKRDKLEIEIFISFETAEENARIYKIDKREEILRLIIHGILHSIGYDDIQKEKRKIMKQVENKLVKKYLKFSNSFL